MLRFFFFFFFWGGGVFCGQRCSRKSDGPVSASRNCQKPNYLSVLKGIFKLLRKCKSPIFYINIALSKSFAIYVRWPFGWRYMSLLHSADETHKGRNSCPLLRSCVIGSENFPQNTTYRLLFVLSGEIW